MMLTHSSPNQTVPPIMISNVTRLLNISYPGGQQEFLSVLHIPVRVGLALFLIAFEALYQISFVVVLFIAVVVLYKK